MVDWSSKGSFHADAVVDPAAIQDVAFLRPVEIGSVVEFEAQVSFSGKLPFSSSLSRRSQQYLVVPASLSFKSDMSQLDTNSRP